MRSILVALVRELDEAVTRDGAVVRFGRYGRAFDETGLGASPCGYLQEAHRC